LAACGERQNGSPAGIVAVENRSPHGDTPEPPDEVCAFFPVAEIVDAVGGRELPNRSGSGEPPLS
jgi:hypothetical protein